MRNAGGGGGGGKNLLLLDLCLAYDKFRVGVGCREGGRFPCTTANT